MIPANAHDLSNFIRPPIIDLPEAQNGIAFDLSHTAPQSPRQCQELEAFPFHRGKQLHQTARRRSLSSAEDATDDPFDRPAPQ
jgi:hypothetical protein